MPALAPHASDDVQFRDLLKDILKTEIVAQPDLAALLLKVVLGALPSLQERVGLQELGRVHRIRQGA